MSFGFLKIIPQLIVKAIQSFFLPLGRDVAISHLTALARLMGKAFGPDGIRHFSDLLPHEQSELLARAPILQTNHEDWPDGLEWIPRKVTAYVGPRPPILEGNTDDAKPIPARGQWFVTRGYLAWTSVAGIHVRMGFRYDDVDHYFEFPSFTIKKF